jgi:uncharacterized protein GlcG (DUF336 family)
LQKGKYVELLARISYTKTEDRHSIKPTATGGTCDSKGNFYVFLQNGMVYRVDPETGWLKEFADYRKRIQSIAPLPAGTPFFDERGLLNLVFDPKDDSVHYIVYSRALTPEDRSALGENAEWFGKAMMPSDESATHPMDHVTVLARVKDGVVQPIWEVPQPQFNHNGGGLVFNPKDHHILYWGLGDGGGMNDMHGELHEGQHQGYAQDVSKPYGKLFRIDLNRVRFNPRMTYFTLPGLVPTGVSLVAKGLRNPWRMTFHPDDPYHLLTADVGQAKWESIKRIPLRQTDTVHNMGWKIKEGTHDFFPELASRLPVGETIIPPILEYQRDPPNTLATVGGYFDTTGQVPVYVFGDYTGRLFTASLGKVGKTVWSPEILTNELRGRPRTFQHSLAPGCDGSVYSLMVDLENRVNLIYRIKLSEQVPIATPRKVHNEIPTLTTEEMDLIIQQATEATKTVKSALRVDAEGDPATVVMQIVVMPRHNPKAYVEKRNVNARHRDTAWRGSEDIARAKAYTALAFSSNENALSTRALGLLSQDNGPLWGIGDSNRDMGIITFPGGLPVYNRMGELIGAIGVSGDGVDRDEGVAMAGAVGFEPPERIRSDTVLDVAYTKQPQ